MIAIYANWTGNLLSVAHTVEEARAKLDESFCPLDTTFGYGPLDLTALDTGPTNPLVHSTPKDKFDILSVAREFFPRVKP